MTCTTLGRTRARAVSAVQPLGVGDGEGVVLGEGGMVAEAATGVGGAAVGDGRAGVGTGEGEARTAA